MRVLMITQRVDRHDDVLGFTTRWISELASHVDQLDVLTGYAGTYDFPGNVAVHSYGKEQGLSKPRRVLRFERLAAQFALRDGVDVVFAHMIPDYVNTVYPWFALRRIPIVLWFAHGTTNPKIQLATRLSRCILTSTEAAFNLSSNKVTRVGQGIDMDVFEPGPSSANRTELLGLGRIDRVKNFETTIDAVGQLIDEGCDIALRIVGEPMRAPDSYLDELKKRAASLDVSDRVTFVGSVPHDEVVREYQRAGVFVNASQTGSLDKTEVEAMACGTPVVSCNKSYRNLVDETKLDGRLAFEDPDSEALADRLRWILSVDDQRYDHLAAESRTAVRNRHSLERQMSRIADVLESVGAGGKV